MNKEGEQVEGGVYYTREVIWANGNILWTYQFTSNVPDYDKQNPGDNVIQCVQYMLTLRQTHGCLG